MDYLTLNRRRIFSNTLVLHEMLRAYKRGITITELSKKYQCDHTSIIYQVQKHGIHTLKKDHPKIIAPKQEIKSDIKYICCGSRSYAHHMKTCANFISTPKRGEVPKSEVTQGKSYAEHLADESLRKAKRFRCFAKVAAFGVPILPIVPVEGI